MKVCTTCGREWDTSGTTCPDDGALLSAVIASSITNSSGQRVALQPQPEPEPDDVDRDELTAGMKVGEYQIERKIGVGGMGVVYGARHPVIGKRAAIKVLNARLSMDREAVSRFVLEAQSVNQIGHANIVDIFSFGNLDDGRSYFVMEWLQGETLGERLDRGGALTTREATTILIALCRALEAAHAAGVIHRDLKPDNVFLATDDEGWRVKLLDFGIAKLSVANPSVSRTATGMVVGTPLFMAPEQAKGETITSLTDVYALGLLAYTMVTGHSLFAEESSAIEVLAAHISKPPLPPRSLTPDLPAALDELILQMVAKQPTARPSMLEVRQRLTELGTRASTGPVVAPRLTTLTPAGPISTVSAVSPKAPTEMVHASEVELPVVPRRARWPLVLGVLAVVGGGAAAFAIVHGSDGKSASANAAAPIAPPIATRAVTPPAPAVVPADAAVAVVAIDAAPAAPPPTELAVVPPDAQLTIDGQPAVITAGHASLALAAGDHVAVASSGGRTAKQAFSVTLDHPTTVSLAVPAAARPRPSTPTTTVHPKPPPVTKPAGVDVDAVQNPFAK